MKRNFRVELINIENLIINKINKVNLKLIISKRISI